MEIHESSRNIESIRYLKGVLKMAKKKQGGSGLMSSAGLMRYYEADKKAIHLDPKTIIVFGLICGVAVLLLNANFGTWP